MEKKIWKKIFMKHSLKWMATFVLALILSVAVGKNMTVFAETTTTDVVFDKEYSGSTESGKVDKYNIMLPKSGCLTVIIESTSWHSWELIDSNYETMDSTGKTGGSRWMFDLTAGSYQLSIAQDYNHNVCDYTVSFHFESAEETYTYENNMYIDVASQAEIPYDKKIIGQLADNDNIDYYKLVVPVDGKVHFSVITDAKEVKLTVNNAQDEVLETLYFRSTGNKASYTLKKGTYYLCFSKVYNNDDYSGVYSFTAAYEMNTPTNLTVKAASYKALKITGEKTCDITGYQINYKKGSGSWKNITVAGNQNLNKTINVTPATYTVQVRAYCVESGTTYYSAWSEPQKVTCKVSTPANIKIKNSTSKAITVTAKKKGAIAGYTIRYKKGSGSWKNIKVAGNRNLNRKIKKLSKGHTYKVQVRAYCKISGKTYYSAWSGAKTIKLKK